MCRGLIVVRLVVVAALGEGLRGNFAALTVLDGDGLHGSGVAQGECCAVERALSRWHAAVGGVADLRAVRPADAHRGGLGKRRLTADGRSRYALTSQVR